MAVLVPSDLSSPSPNGTTTAPWPMPTTVDPLVARDHAAGIREDHGAGMESFFVSILQQLGNDYDEQRPSNTKNTYGGGTATTIDFGGSGI